MHGNPYSNLKVDVQILLSVDSQKFGAGDKVTYNGKDYLCNKCLEVEGGMKTKLSGKGGMVEAPTQNGSGDGPSVRRPVTSTPAKPEQVMLDGTLSSPVSDRSDLSDDSKL